MKLNDVKHNHSLTDLLKILIFSILMMIPFIDVGIRCAYVVCNKNAYQSYYGETINEISYQDVNEVVVGEDYKFYAKNSTFYTSPAIDLYISNFDNIDSTNATALTNIVNQKDNINHIRIFNYSNQFSVIWFYYNETQYYNIDLNNQMVTFTYHLNSFTGNGAYFSEYNQIAIYNNYSYLDNVFNYSVNKLTTSELYTWTQQTAIYTGVQTMCAQLGINNTVIPLLLVYWFILTVIYIIIDIVLKLFTMLTHAIGSKTA